MAVLEQVTAPFVLPRLSDDVLLAKFFRALGDPTRLRILEAVMDDEKNVTALVELTGAPGACRAIWPAFGGAGLWPRGRRGGRSSTAWLAAGWGSS
ncbi:MAG: ArsR/SmtB family transcription factor [bacterium]